MFMVLRIALKNEKISLDDCTNLMLIQFEIQVSPAIVPRSGRAFRRFVFARAVEILALCAADQ
jgi:hypothetical protein